MARARTSLKMLIALVVVMTAICVFNASTVKANNDTEGDFPFNMFSMLSVVRLLKIRLELINIPA